MKRVTFSRNYTLSLSRTCRCYCKYCAFATHKAHLHPPDEVERRLDDATRRGCKELLVLTGEKPECNDEVRRRLHEYGHEDFTSYVVWACERALERGLLPHSNLGVLDRDELARLREVNASMGLMLESVSERLMETVHAGSPTKHPRARLGAIEAAGELKIPFTSGILVGIGETEDERVASLEALAAVHARHGHIQEVILQNFVPHPSYYGREVAEIADAAARRRWSGEADGGVVTGEAQLPEWATPITVEEMGRLVRECRRLLPGVGIQIPPNLSDWWLPLVRDGATDLGGLSANGDHISPEHPFPSAHQVRKRLAPEGYALTERLCVYPQYIDPEWVAQGVLDAIKLKYWSFIPRKGSGRRREVSVGADVAPRAIEKARDNQRLSEEELTALFSERRPEVVEDIRLAADEIRAPRRRHRHVRGQPQHQLHQHLPGRLRVLRIRAGPALARRVPSRGARLRGEGRGSGRVRRHGDLHAGRDPSRLHARGLRPLAAAGEGDGAARPPARVLADGDPLHVRALRPLTGRGVRVPTRVRARLDARHRRRGAARRRSPADLAEQAARQALGRDHGGLAARRALVERDGDVRPH